MFVRHFHYTVGSEFYGLGAALDLPVDCLSAFTAAASFDPSLFPSIISLPPIKVVQAACELFLGRSSFAASTVEVASEVLLSPSAAPLSLTTFSPRAEKVDLADKDAKAVKSDDAAIDEDFWNRKAVTLPSEWGGRRRELALESWGLVVTGLFLPEVHNPIFNLLRDVMSTRFCINVASSFRRYLKATYSSIDKVDSELAKDLVAGRDAISRAAGSTFWDWSAGSYPFFWRWQSEIMSDMRDGTKLFRSGPWPRYLKAQKMPRDEAVSDRIKGKINKVRDRGYISAGPVLSLTSYFHVPKGESDIRIVYDLTACGLNEVLWAPSFWMPTILNVLDCSCHSSWFGDVDAGEMFLNYMLDESVRPYAGVDVSWSLSDADLRGRKRKWEQWMRMAMGMRPSPWVTTRLFAWGMEIIKGNRLEERNPFHWTIVVINCPGMAAYNPMMPRLYKWNPLLSSIASDCKTFVDDLRSIGATEQACRNATHRVETMMGYLVGLQDATRKRRPESQSPGEWTGSISRAIEGVGLFVTVSPKKWTKAKNHIAWLLEHFKSPSHLPHFNLKEVERKVGFLVHLAMTYPLMFPFLRSLYLTMNSWRPDRDKNSGWKLSRRAYSAFLEAGRKEGKENDASEVNKSEKGSPELVGAVTGLYDHLKSLETLFDGEEPTLRLIRGASMWEVCYVFGDASGEGFGASWLEHRRDGTVGDLGFRFGVWGAQGDNTSSNYREMRNLIETLEAMGRDGSLEGREVFTFTDNIVSESIAAKGSSKNKILYDLVVRLYLLEMKFKCRIQLVHVAGTRMIDQGTDGLSRGSMFEGVMQGQSMLHHLPLHIGALDRCPALEAWIKEWAGSYGMTPEVLSPEDWFERGHDFIGSGRTNVDGYWIPMYKRGTMIWSPPPGVDRFAIEELRQARHKRQDSLHIFVCPRLMFDEWRRHMYKSADLIFEIPAGVSEIWPATMHETLIVCIYFPYLNRKPWELRGSRFLVELARPLSRLCKVDHSSVGGVLSELLGKARTLESLSVRELSRVLSRYRPAALPSAKGIQ